MPGLKRKRSRTRRWIAGTLVLLLVCGIAVAGHWVYRKGMSREGTLQQADRAFHRQDYARAAELARRAMAEGQDHQKTHELLIQALVQDGRIDEAEQAAHKLLDEGPDRSYLRLSLCRLALRKNDLLGASRMARSLTAAEPAFANTLLAIIQDQAGIASNNWRQRLGAAATLRGLAALTDEHAVRTEALFRSSSIVLEVAPFLASSERLVQRARTDLKDAETAVNKAHQADHAFPYELWMALIRVLSEDEEEADLGAKVLRKYTTGVDRIDQAIAMLALYHLRRQERIEAVDLIRKLEDSYLWARVFYVLDNGGHRDVALKVLDSGPRANDPERIMRRAGLLLQGEKEEEKARGRDLVEKLVSDPATETPLVLRALVILALRTDVATARDLAERAGLEKRDDRRITALLAYLLSGTEDDRVHALELARELAGEIDSFTESRETLRLLGRGSALMQSYLDTQIAKGGEYGQQHRLGRALSNIARARGEKDSAEVRKLRTKVLGDLQAMLDSKESTKRSLFGAFTIAASLGEGDMAGRLLGRALALPGEPQDLGVRMLELAFNHRNQDAIKTLAGGVTAVAPQTGAEAFLRAYAHTMVSQGATDASLIDEFEAAAGAEDGSRLPSLELACRIAMGHGKLERAERHARAIMAADTDSAIGRELLGEVLLRSEKWQEVVDFYQGGASRTERGTYQLIGALHQVGRKEEALRVAAAALDAYPNSPMAYVVLARIHYGRGEQREALSVLNIAPTEPYVALMRAELFEHFKDYVMAEQLYEALLFQGGFRYDFAWSGLHRVLAAQGRSQDFIELSGKVLAGEALADAAGARAVVHQLRGQALEADGKLHEALADYEQAIKHDAKSWGALNNAAWHIAVLAPGRIQTAKGYIDRAMAIKPNMAEILDTAAEVYSVLREHAKALGYVDSSISLRPAGQRARYLVHKGKILIRADREDQARVLLQKVMETFEADPAATQAKEMIWKLDLKNLPDEQEDENG